jgi:hypothetical protein
MVAVLQIQLQIYGSVYASKVQSIINYDPSDLQWRL